MNQSKRNHSQPVSFLYRLKFQDQNEVEFTINLSGDTLAIISDKPTPSEWTRLTVNQCPNCLLDPEHHEFCPAATNIDELVCTLGGSISYEEVDVWVETRNRTYHVKTTLGVVISSLMGIYMVASGCPILDKMRPMVETHLPLYTGEETLYRVISMYLMAQYFRWKNGLEPNWDLQGLADFYKDVQIVNLHFTQRLRSISSCKGEAIINAISLLDSFGELVKTSILYDVLDHWQGIFMAAWGGRVYRQVSGPVKRLFFSPMLS